MKTHNKLFIRCYYAFLVSGLSVLVVGAIMPYLIEEYGISYGIAGSFLSCFAIGNLLASFFSPYLAGKIGSKPTIVILSTLVPTSFFVIYLVPPVGVLYVVFLLAGIGRGAISNINNSLVNDLSNGKPAPLNILHTFFAIGAFLAPFLTSTYIALGLTWKHVMLTSILLSLISVVGYATMTLEGVSFDKPKKKSTETSTIPQTPFYKSIDFYLIGLLLFFYLGFENCVNGWFVTYLKSTDIMSSTYATNLVSVLWIVVIVGRLTCAYLSKRISKKLLILVNSLGCVIFFLLLISAQNVLFITICMIGLGFFLAGIYPTSIANAGTLIKGSPAAMASLLAIASLGGIIMPQVVGALADQMGIIGAMSLLAIDVILMLILALINNMRKVIN